MRFSNVILALSGIGLSATAALVGCGNSSTANSGGSGGAAGSTTASGTTTATSGTGGTTFPCSPKASCTAKDKECLGLVDNSGKTKFGLRMSDLVISKPAALATGLVASVVSGSVTANFPACNENGGGTFSWLLQFDTAAGTLTTGGAKPVADATKGYSFTNEMVSGIAVAPAVYNIKPDASGKFDIMTGVDLNVPVYLDAAATMAVVLPLKRGRLTMGTLSPSQNCIGSYNASGLQPADSCQPTAKHALFNTGASLDGIITLEDADKVVISAVMESLCVALSGNATMYATKNAAGINVCKRDASNNILFQGDTCSTAGGTCTDSVGLGADFAANSVTIN